MNLLLRLLRAVRSSGPAQRLFHFDNDLVESLQALAEREQRTEEEVAADLLSTALAQRDAAEACIRVWRELSVREQQVTAFTCLNYTNRQMAARLHISPETVKTHMRNALRKYGARSKAELRRLLADWDFSEWR
ncbi:MAG: helix-turn-helix transcriptional regulator [Anaerolineales bacterium]|nr:helix-turn-helix transcriptional regulator [Anaerolineales bacterium]